eukprot:827688-Pelagomonas_calceolata.AAC.3
MGWTGLRPIGRSARHRVQLLERPINLGMNSFAAAMKEAHSFQTPRSSNFSFEDWVIKQVV